MSKQIKLNKEKKMDLVVDGTVYLVGKLYEMKAGEDEGQVGELASIEWDETGSGFWWLKLSDGNKFNADHADQYLEERDSRDFLKCRHCGGWNDK